MLKYLQKILNQKYQKIFTIIKIFCKKNSIYGENFGFLNEKALIILAYYLDIVNPTLPLKEIPLNLIKIFKNNFIIEIDKNINTNINLDEYLNIDKNKNWKILLPGKYTYNALYTINKTTEEIIKKQLNIGYQLFNNYSITDWYKNDNFVKQYENLFLIICYYSNNSLNGPQFCDFIENNLRNHLQIEIENKVNLIEYIHIKPLKLLNSEECPSKQFKLNEEYKDWICTIWVSGIKWKNEEKKGKLNEFKQFINKLKENLMKQFKGEINEQSSINDFNLGFNYIKSEQLEEFTSKDKN
ncbi:hypothetical protein Mgra_00007573, partial [Meloidogyne graminicola]